MKTVSATDANRHFSKILKAVSRGDVVTVISRGKAVATSAPIEAKQDQRHNAHQRLMARLCSQGSTGQRGWMRGELYE